MKNFVQCFGIIVERRFNSQKLLVVLLYIVLAYLMLFAALTNAVCIMLLFLPLISENAF